MSHVPQLPGRQRLHPAEREPLTVWLTTSLKAYVLVLAQQEHISPSTLVERLLVTEQRARGMEMPAETAPKTLSEASQSPDLCPAALTRHPETVPCSLQALLRAEFDAVTATLATAVTEQVNAFTGQLPALIRTEVARALQAAGIAGNTVRCGLGTGPVVTAATPPSGASSPGSGVLPLAPSALRQRIVAVLQNRLEGLTPPQVQALIGTDTDLRALMRRMFREGVIARPAKGVYAVKTPGAPRSRLDT